MATVSKTKETPKLKYIYAVGRRKRAIAQVKLFEKGKGDIIINSKKAEEYMNKTLVSVLKTPLKITDLENKVDLSILVKGGGQSGQAEAIRHGISRAIDKINKEKYHKTLKVAGFLTRDDRIKERKKPGLKRARRAPQWAKR